MKAAKNQGSISIPRVAGAGKGHYTQWVEACMKGYGKMQLSEANKFVKREYRAGWTL
jgi:hypothetical protein